MTRAPLLLATLAALSASAAPKRIIVDAPAPARKAVEAAFPRGSVVKGPAFDERDPESVMDATREARAEAAVKARVEAKQLTVELFNAADGASLASVRVPMSKKLKALPKSATSALVKALARAHPARAKSAPPSAPPPLETPPPPPVAETRPAREQAPESPASAAEVAHAAPEPARSEQPVDALHFRLGSRVFQRTLKWSEDASMQLGGYDLAFAPSIAIEGQLFPAAFFTRGALAHVGLSVAYEQSIGIKSTDVDGETFSTNAARFRIGALARIPISRFALMPHAGWSMQSFTIAATSLNGAARLMPNVRYGTIRAGLLVGVQLVGPLSVEAGGAYQLVLSSGEIASSGYFPRATTGGADFEAAAVLRVTKNLELRLSAEYLRYWLTLNAQPDDPWIASRATDEYKSLLLTAAFVL